MTRPTDYELVNLLRKIHGTIAKPELGRWTAGQALAEEARIAADALEVASVESFEAKVDAAIQATLAQKNVSKVERKNAVQDQQFREDMRVALRAAGVAG
jgi:hypothetical protein